MANRTIAIGDIHGCAAALRSLLAVIKPVASDTLITLGDYVDRGPSSAEVLDIMTELITVCSIVPILGNHEIMMMNALKSRREFEFWMYNGGNSTLASYGGDMNNMPMHHRTFLNFCKSYYETDTHIFLHASYDPYVPLNQQPDELLFWQHVGDSYVPPPHGSGKTVVCGHTPQSDGDIGDLGHIKLIDTYCYGDQWLTAYDVDTGHYIQARADGMLRADRSEFPAGTTQVATGFASEELKQHLKVDLSEWPFNESNRSPLELSGDEFQQSLAMAGDRLAAHLDRNDDYPSHHEPTPSDLEKFTNEIVEPIPTAPTDLETLLDRVIDDYVPQSYNTAGSGYLAYIPGGGLPDSSIGDLVGSITNRFASVWVAAPFLAQIESTVVSWFCQLVGYPIETSGGFLTTGGSIANFSGIVAARVKTMGDDFQLGCIYASDQVHHCVNKAAFMAGIPKSNLKIVPVNDDLSIDVRALHQMMKSDMAAGFRPMMVVASAGTTNTGAVDDLQNIRKLCDKAKTWMHVDAAYGGFFMLTKHGQQKLKGIETADSIVLDPHKGLFCPYGSGCLLVKDRNDLSPAFSFTSEYMPEMTGERFREDFCEISPELSRENRGLRLWLPIKRHGIQVFQDLLEEKLRLAQWAAQQVESLGERLNEKCQTHQIEMVARPQLSTLAFRLVDQERTDQSNDELNQQWLREINARGQVMLTGTTINDRFVVRISVLAVRTHIDRMQMAMQIICETAEQVLAGSAVS